MGGLTPSRAGQQAQASRLGVQANIASADRFAANVLPVIREIQAAGIVTLQGIAKALNARGVRTARGRKWYPNSVKRVLARKSRLEDMKVGAA